jgi:predicted nucleotidyltransferase
MITLGDFMNIIGVIAEYNPFHNGHIYQIKKIKELYKDSIIIAVTSSSFCQRGDLSIINKWNKTKVALENGVDLVVELPFVYSTQSADVFAKGALEILNHLKVDTLIFGTEIDNLDKLISLAKKQLESDQKDLKKYLKEGYNYPTALSKSIDSDIKEPNNLLAISYIKEILKSNYKIEPISIKRTNSYHNDKLDSDIVSATAIRKNLNDKNLGNYLPKNEVKDLYKIDYDYLFKLLKYKIISDINILNTYQTVDEGIENKIKKVIDKSDNFEDLIKNIKSKRYTYNKIKRMLIHILTSFTKEEAKRIKIDYIRVLGFNNNGKVYLNKIKKDVKVPLVTSYKNNNSEVLNIEYRVTNIYSLIVNDTNLIEREKEKPIIR